MNRDTWNLYLPFPSFLSICPLAMSNKWLLSLALLINYHLCRYQLSPHIPLTCLDFSSLLFSFLLPTALPCTALLLLCPQGLITNHSLTSLSLRQNNIGHIGGTAFVSLYKVNATLLDLCLADNDIGVEAAAQIIGLFKFSLSSQPISPHITIFTHPLPTDYLSPFLSLLVFRPQLVTSFCRIPQFIIPPLYI